MRRRPGRDRVDRTLAAVFLVLGVAELLLAPDRHGPLGLDVLLFVLAAGCLALRRRTPLAAILGYYALALVRSAVLTPTTESVALIFGLLLLAFTAAQQLPTRRAVLAGAAGLLTVLGVDVLEGLLTFGDIVFPFVFFVALPWLVGRMVRSRTLLARELQERNARLEADGERAARAAAQEERRRIARELHDVVAHSLSVMVVQAGAGRRLASTDPAQAEECARLVERVGRDALGEMRRLLGVMRPEGERHERVPQPGLAALADLVSGTRAAGLPVELRVRGEPRALSSGLDLAAFRIVQEALTNALKHAGPARARVSVAWHEEDLELEVVDDGRGPGGEDGTGHGLVGMRERATLYGGEVVTGRARGGGFRVRARFPLPVREAAPGTAASAGAVAVE